MERRTILVWFRNDLRVHDNEILLRAVERSHRIVPVFCFDPRYFGITRFGTRKTGVLRAAFLIENVNALKKALQERGGDLIVAHGYPEEILPEIAQQYQVDEVYHHREVAHEETQISALVEAALWKLQINLRHFIGHTLYHKEDLPFPIRDIPDAFSVFRKKTERESEVRPQLPTPDAIRVPAEMATGAFPNLTELGYSDSEAAEAEHLAIPGGEAAALTCMGRFLHGLSVVDDAALSPYIALGALSPNTLYHATREAEQADPANKRYEQLILKLMWRDYYRFMFKKHGNRFFHATGLTGVQQTIPPDEDARFERWKTAHTGQPVVDRIMRDMNRTGYVTHRERILAAAYLIQELQVSWLKGAAWFEEKLLDYCPANNYGNWAHLAGVGSSDKDNKPVDLIKLIAQCTPKEIPAIG